jgi:formate dehydrogenase maturation protein FdhE
MERVAAAPAVAPRWGERRRRATRLQERWPYAGEMLRLYASLLDAQERAYVAALDDQPRRERLAAYVADRVMGNIVEETLAAGPAALVEAARERFARGGLDQSVRRWLDGEAQPPVDDYLARAAAAPVLEALGAGAWPADTGERAEGHCPRCGGRPQLSVVGGVSEELLTPPRRLLCCRCGEEWIHERMACPACGERTTSKLPIFSDAERLPHLRADSCESCRRYLITVDLRRDSDAVPVVDELVALPIDLHMQERGFAKIVPNLMGI